MKPSLALAALLLAGVTHPLLAQAQDPPATAPAVDAEAAATPEAPSKPQAPAAPPGTLRFHLMDGTVITGRFQTQTLPIKTEFGDLVVPVTAIYSFAPGLASHPELDKQIGSLIDQLADPSAKARDKAQTELVGFGAGIIPELQRFANDHDAERKARIATIIEELLSLEDDFGQDRGGPVVSLNRLDTIETEHFTIAGEIQQGTFKIRSKFGELVVELADVKTAQRIRVVKPETRKSIGVSGADMAGRNYKSTGIRINRGDKIIITADGKITLTPWGNNVVSTPDGVAQNGMYNGTIPLGALAGRIGDSGEEFLVGRKKTFVAERSGVLQLGFAMQQNWANYQFPGEYEAKIRVVPTE